MPQLSGGVELQDTASGADGGLPFETSYYPNSIQKRKEMTDKLLREGVIRIVRKGKLNQILEMTISLEAEELNRKPNNIFFDKITVIDKGQPIEEQYKQLFESASKLFGIWKECIK
jgi:hypothetical protein